MNLEPEQLLEAMVKELADHPEQVRIESHIGESTATFDIHVALSDVGKVLGRQGSHAMALRTLFNAVYGKRGKRLHLQVVDPQRR